MLIATMAMYFIPIFFYSALFRKGNIFGEVLLGYIPFLFYTPTYLNILNAYSLCRIDDISWGTKGLDEGSEKNSDLKESWKQLKFVHVTKYILWNVIFSSILLTLGASYTTRFFVTLTMMGIITLSLAIKVIIGIGYMFSYKFKICCFEKKKPTLANKSRVAGVINRYTDEIMGEVRDNLNDIKEEYIRGEHRGTSFIQASRSKKNIMTSYRKQQAEQKGKSGVLRKFSSKKQSSRPQKT
jgi:hypothetical protein